MSGIWTPPKGVTFLRSRRYRPTEEIRTLPNGERVRVTVDDSGTVTQVEHNHTLDAIVRPRTIALKIQRGAHV